MRTRTVGLVALGLLAGCAADPTLGDDAPGDDGGTDACPCPGGDGGGGGIDGGGGAVGCDDDPGAAAQPFGNHARGYAPGVILPGRPQAELDGAVRAFYDTWRARYLRQGCGDGRWYVATGLDNSLTVSEAHGYGMIIVAYLAGHDPEARTIFDGMVRYFEDHPSDLTPSLMAWSQDHGCQNNQGAANASDGDLDIAYALLLADKQWSSGGAIDYRAAAARVLAGIRDANLDASGSYVLLGDWTSGSYYDATRTSDFMPAHLASFAAATGDPVWTQVADHSYDLIAQLQSTYAPSTGLLPDFVRSPLSGPYPAEAWFLERPVDGAYSYNACRDPWRIATDVLVNGEPRARAAVQRINTWIRGATGGDPWAILPGYWLDGSGLGNTFFDLAFVAPLGVSAMVDAGNQAWLDALWDAIVSAGETTYYGDTLKLLAMIAMSGNWWSPEAAPCP